MKFFIKQINELLNKIEKGTIKGLLLYGPDKGYISRISEIIIKKFDFLSITYTYQNISSAGHLQTLLNTKNFFNKKEFIKITNIPSTLDQKFKLVLASEFNNFPVFIGDELTPNSSVRNFFEKEEYLASLACYHDEEQNILKLILKKCQEASKSIDDEALKFLKENLKGDHRYIISELEKIIFYTYDQEKISYEDVEKIISDNLLSNSENMCIYFCQQNLEGFLKELSKLRQENINEILIIRALIRYFLNLYIVLSKKGSGINIDEAMRTLSPPIFFKYLNDFKINLNRFTLKKILKVLSILQQSEIIFKINPNNFDFYQQIYLKIYD